MSPLSLRADPIDETRRQLRFSIALVNPFGHELGEQTLWLYLPASLTPTQRLLDVQVQAPHTRLSDALDHAILQLRFPRFAPLAQKQIGVTAELAMRAEPNPVVSFDRQAWLAPERYIESDDPRIREQAARLSGASDWQTARAIYDWVAQHIRYAGYLPDDLGALHALLQREGDCTEYADLVVALARAVGIPARMVGGYVIARSAIVRPEDYHNWAELYLDGTWRLVDAQKRNWLAPAEDYVAFRIYRDAAVNPIGHAHRFRLEGQLQARLV
ncbi:MAG: transglutaminase domain-containing protein [Betaproteobacteria bacterium]|nr:transglutaminase domain-containing protein [Betaproteobacteria bacterium]